VHPSSTYPGHPQLVSQVSVPHPSRMYAFSITNALLKVGIMQRHTGSYLGTEIDERWWKRYKQGGSFARGSGEYWFDKEALFFRRYLTKKPLRIPFTAIERVELGTAHAGKWLLGQPIVKIVWLSHDQVLSSGIANPGGKEGSERLIQQLKTHLLESDAKA
jgi:hypothetical protein